MSSSNQPSMPTRPVGVKGRGGFGAASALAPPLSRTAFVVAMGPLQTRRLRPSCRTGPRRATPSHAAPVRLSAGWSRRCGPLSRRKVRVPESKWLMGSFDDADVTSMCDGNDEKSCAWWLADVVSAGHITNQE